MQTPFIIHPKAASHPHSMKKFVDIVNRSTNINVKNIFEIGANYGQDAKGLQHYFNLKEKDVWVFEAHPEICKEIKILYPEFNIFDNAVFNKNQNMTFNIVDLENNSGVSSLRNNDNFKTTRKTTIEAIRMDGFMKDHSIESVDFLKLDVEGCNYEVLEGFGERLKDVKCLHIEAEHRICWKKQKLYKDIEKILKSNGFEMLFFERYITQSDSFWVQKRYLKQKSI